ncbi:MAG: SspB family protein [Cohaesibacter sp.]|jgi:hypothetical protein|nr:SspB family protein [Cohaesibacter sp.]
MSEDLIRYDILAQDALRGVVKKVLTEVASTGLPGEHHFYITFNTHAPGVRLSSRLLEKYPSDMTIVLQHQFWDMQANDVAIEIGLSFDGIPEKLYIPYTAIISFIDPSVHFSLQFEVESELDEDNDDEESLISADEEGEIILSVMSDAASNNDDSDDNKSAKGKSKADSKGSDEDTSSAEEESKSGAEVVSLDAFRKK